MLWKPAVSDTKKKRFAFQSALLPLASGLIVTALLLFALIVVNPLLKTTIGALVFNSIAAVVAIFAMSLTNYYAFRLYREQDEVQQASIGFAAKWGVPVGQAAFVLLLFLPPFKDLMTVVVSEFAGDPGTTVDRHVVVVAMVLGFCGVVLLQFIGTLIVGAIWWRSKR